MVIAPQRSVNARSFAALTVIVLLGLPAATAAAPITIRSIGGADAAAIQGTVDEFRMRYRRSKQRQYGWIAGQRPP